MVRNFSIREGSDRAGNILSSRLIGQTAGLSPVIHSDDVLVGALTQVNQPPEAFAILFPTDTTIYVGGAANEAPIAPDSLFTVSWSSSTDPDEDAIRYTWQLSTDALFESLLVDASSANEGQDTSYQVTYGLLAQTLDGQEMSEEGMLTLYHRALASDGTNSVSSDTASVTFIRGTLVNSEEGPLLPESFALYANFPNPFNAVTTFRFDLPDPQQVQLIVYNSIGQEVAQLISKELHAGSHEFEWDASQFPSGVYLYRLKASTFTKVRSMILVK